MLATNHLQHLIAWARQERLALFPIRAWNKQPAGVVHSHATDWSMDPAQWERWYQNTGGCNFGVACAPSRLIVVDVDQGGSAKFDEWYGFKMEAWRTVQTPSGGAHYYYRIPDDIDAAQLRQPNLCGKEVNVRAGHGYVVAPWSQTRVGADPGVKADGEYKLIHARIYPAPARLVEHCAPQRQGPTIEPVEEYELAQDGMPVDAILRGEVTARTTTLLDRLLQAVPGERNDLLNKTGFGLGKIVAEGKLAQWRAEDMILHIAMQIGIPHDEAKALGTIRSGLKAAAIVGHAEPKSAIAQLLAYPVPIAHVAPLPPAEPPRPTSLIPLEPLVERLLYQGQITVLSGQSGSGKTTFIASMMAASVADANDFMFGDFGANLSDISLRPCCWIFMSYEGGQHIHRTTQAFHIGSRTTEKFSERVEMLDVDDGCLVAMNDKRQVVVNEAQIKRLTGAIDRMRARFPGLPVVVVFDNATAAVENCMDQVHAQMFMRCMKALARQGCAVVVLAHPPKSGHSDVFGSHVFHSLADTSGQIEVLRNEDGEWVQWIEFSKHREAPNGMCLEIRSRRIDRPIVELPAEWGRGNQRARERQIKDLHIPYVTMIRVRNKRDRDYIEKGVALAPAAVTQKTETVVPV